MLYRRNIVSAYKWHMIFSLIYIAIPFSSLTEPEVSYVLYNYTKFKLTGPRILDFIRLRVVTLLTILSSILIDIYKKNESR